MCLDIRDTKHNLHIYCKCKHSLIQELFEWIYTLSFDNHSWYLTNFCHLLSQQITR